MAHREFHYRWEWQFQASPEQLWPLVADTNRFDRDAGLPSYAEDEESGGGALANSRRRLRIHMYGVPLDYVEEPFEWIRPYRFGITRNYLAGPIPLVQPLAQTRAMARLEPLAGGGTHLIYEIWAWPRNLLGYLAIPWQIGFLYARSFSATFNEYDRLATSNQDFFDLPGRESQFPPGGRQRLAASKKTLIDQGTEPALVERLVELIEQADDLTLNKMRPYALADHWRYPRSQVLEMSLNATRQGILNFQWDLLCPLCRVPKDSAQTLAGITRQVHCDTCNINYTVNFERSVELTFRPNPTVRLVDEHVEFCTAGPQAMPHVALQQLLPPGNSREIEVRLEEGRYRVRTLALPGGQFVQVSSEGETAGTIRAVSAGWPDEEQYLSSTPTLTLVNDTEEEQLFILERLAWTDQAATAAEVTTLQQFRDLFADEALRPGDQISVGSLTILFTDLRGSTRMYQEIGDAPAFGLVMDHFDVVKQAIAAENGAIVKTIGDAVMAVFRRPISALQAIMNAQHVLDNPPEGQRPLQLKAALHFGPCIAVSLNGRLDYFGSVVNAASRLEKFSHGGDVVASESVYTDPEVRDLLAEKADELMVEPFEEMLRGFEEEKFALWRIRRIAGPSSSQ